MLNTWAAATIVALVAGVVGFFIVLRGSSFVAHAVPQSAFAGAAGAALIGVNAIIGLGVFSLLGAATISVLGRRGRHDVATALAIVTMLGLGGLFLSWSQEYSSQIYSLLFGEVLGVSRLLFGSDSSFFPRGWHGVILEQQAKALYELGLDALQASQILCSNLEQLHMPRLLLSHNNGTPRTE